MTVKIKRKGRSETHTVKADAILKTQRYKADIESNASELEDEFANMYLGGATGNQFQVIRPPYDPRALRRLAQKNNTLGPCISAMEVNIDGTGADVDPVDEDDDSEEDADRASVQNFVDEPWPGMSLITMRRRFRRDQEEVGYGYGEIIRNAVGEIMFMRRVDPTTMRKVKLGEPVERQVVVSRGGESLTVTMAMRRRVFIQIVGTSQLYFKEYGVEGDLNKKTGEWADQSGAIPYDQRASEIIEFKVQDDVDTPYGVPRWITQVPSVIGSRKAEEANLDLFESGGIPPALIFLLGSQATSEGEEQLNAVLENGSKLRAGVVSLQSTEGAVDERSQVGVHVEKFGSEQASDAMYQKYDDASENRVRRAFRLPPLFIGKTEDYTYATAYASYLVAESQIFEPERLEFDEIMNNGPIKEIGQGRYNIKSKPINTKDISAQLRGLELVSNRQAISNETLVDAINDITSLGLEYSGTEMPTPPPAGESVSNSSSGASSTNPDPLVKVSKAEGAWIEGLVERAMEAAGMNGGSTNKHELMDLNLTLKSMSAGQVALFKEKLSQRTAQELGQSPEHVKEACACSFNAITNA